MTPRRFVTIALALAAILAFSSAALATPGAAAPPLSLATAGASGISLLRNILSFAVAELLPPGPSDFEAAPPEPTTPSEETPQGGQDGSSPFPSNKVSETPPSPFDGPHNKP